MDGNGWAEYEKAMEKAETYRIMIHKATEKAAMWKGLALEAAERACVECEEYAEGRKHCGSCRIQMILKMGEKDQIQASKP